MAESGAKAKANGVSRASKPRTSRSPAASASDFVIRFSATLHRPLMAGKAVSWTFLTLPEEASTKLPSRGMTTVEGTFKSVAFQATLEPDGKGGHWLKVERKLSEAAGAVAGDTVSLEIAPVEHEPEPNVPPELRKALANAQPKDQAAWSDITPVARRDWIQWI
jgi:hypothetical protein